MFRRLCWLAATAACVFAVSAAPAALADETEAAHRFSGDILGADFAELVKTLASDEFEGRAPGTPGEDKAVRYIQAQFQRIGLEPGFGDGWFQPVPVKLGAVDTAGTMRVAVGGKTRTLKFGDDMLLYSRTGRSPATIRDSELVFVGYGVDAPEHRWNDYAGIDVRGKTVVMLSNDPGYFGKDPELFEGPRLTEYGKRTTKAETAARKGAAAVLTIFDPSDSPGGWATMRNVLSQPLYEIDEPGARAASLQAQGLIAPEPAAALFADAGLDLAALRKAADRRGFKAVPLAAKMSAVVRTDFSALSSRNVAGLLRGSERPDEVVVYTAHWDHMGVERGRAGDAIFNGAVDNASGVAAMLEVAGRMAAQGRPKRSVLFLALGLEERGLLGSQYYVRHPAFALNKTVAVLNFDALNVFARTHDLSVMNSGDSDLKDLLAAELAKQGRVPGEELAPNIRPDSDHSPFLRAGVPGLWTLLGAQPRDPALPPERAPIARFFAIYHTPADQFDPARWDLDAAVEDVQAMYGVGRTLADGQRWPQWSPGSPQRAVREQSLGDGAAR